MSIKSMDQEEAKRRAQEFDFAGEIICVENASADGIGSGRVLIVKEPGQPPLVGREAMEHLRSLMRYLSAKREQANQAVSMIAGGSPKEVLNGERIAPAKLEKEDA